MTKRSASPCASFLPHRIWNTKYQIKDSDIFLLPLQKVIDFIRGRNVNITAAFFQSAAGVARHDQIDNWNNVYQYDRHERHL
jgi:hypothetical protein